jgi:hypothetical protein
VYVHLIEPRAGFVEPGTVDEGAEILECDATLELEERPLDHMLQLRTIEGAGI